MEGQSFQSLAETGRVGQSESLSDILDFLFFDQGGLPVFLRGFIDESGVHDGSGITCVAVVVARPSQWKKWVRKWAAHKSPINIFHAVDCANLRGEFSGWSSAQRDEYVKQLLPVINGLDYTAQVVGINNRDLEAAMVKYPALRGFVGSPYSFCLQVAIQKLLFFLQNKHSDAVVTFIHEDTDYTESAVQAFKWIKTASANSKWELCLSFASKSVAMPLQVADIFAYEGNKRMRNPSAQERRAWRALNTDKNKVGLDLFDAPAIDEWVRILLANNAAF